MKENEKEKLNYEDFIEIMQSIAEDDEDVIALSLDELLKEVAKEWKKV